MGRVWPNYLLWNNNNNVEKNLNQSNLKKTNTLTRKWHIKESHLKFVTFPHPSVTKDYFLKYLRVKHLKFSQSFLLTDALMTFFFIQHKKKKGIFSPQKSKVCCYGNCEYQCMWLKVCLAGMMAQTSFWSHILSHSSLVKSLCCFCPWSPFLLSLPINVLDISFQPWWNFS